ncbi:hypothetical protein HOY82DRAFT_598055 [Tuber indicum]|nr:hypothetical protein HOY82DRAFT_598055 [Tuber indicum]
MILVTRSREFLYDTVSLEPWAKASLLIYEYCTENRTNSHDLTGGENRASSPNSACGSLRSAGAIAGGVAVLTAIGAGIWTLLHHRRGSADLTGEPGATVGAPGMGTGENPRHEIV